MSLRDRLDSCVAEVLSALAIGAIVALVQENRRLRDELIDAELWDMTSRGMPGDGVI